MKRLWVPAALALALATSAEPRAAHADEPKAEPSPRVAAPPRLPMPRDPAVRNTGTVLTGLGVFGLVTGLLVLRHAASQTGDAQVEGQRVGGAVLGGSGIFIAVGVPLWIWGSSP